MVSCLECGVDTTNPKFCSSSCAATYSNSRRPPKGKKYFCDCGELIGIGWKFKRYKHCKKCVDEISHNYRDWTKITLKDLFLKLNRYQAHARIRSLARAIVRKKGKQVCASCSYNKHVEVCHIVPIKNFDETISIAKINEENNLICLCPNCHWEFDHGLLDINMQGNAGREGGS
jgi:hypothetical protein